MRKREAGVSTYSVPEAAALLSISQECGGGAGQCPEQVPGEDDIDVAADDAAVGEPDGLQPLLRCQQCRRELGIDAVITSRSADLPG
jgi:hypothetical protein